MKQLIEFLKGKKTYYLTVVGILYIGGALLGFYDLDEKVLGLFGLGFVASFRSAFKTHFGTPTSVTVEETKESASAAGGNVTLHPIILLCLVPLFFCGCAVQRVVEFNPETKALTKYTGFALFNRSALEGLAVGKRTTKSATVFSLDKGGTETQTEAIQAMGQALGAGIAEGAKVAITGKP
jgi:hypothetical protein